MTTDLTERGLERLICKALTGDPCDPPSGRTVGEPPRGYGGGGWSPGNHHDYNREYCVDLVQLGTFLHATQPNSAPALRLDEDCPTRRKFLARLQGEIAKRGTIDVLRNGIRHQAHTTSTSSTAHPPPTTRRPSGASARTSSASPANSATAGTTLSARWTSGSSSTAARFHLRAQEQPHEADVQRRHPAVQAGPQPARTPLPVRALRGALRG